MIAQARRDTPSARRATIRARGTWRALPKILIVDDEPGIRFGVRDFLESEGLEVEEAETIASAERAVREGHPDAVVLDHMLPDGTALDFLPRLREIDPTLPVVVLTGHATIDLAVRAVKEGADQFLAKPWSCRPSWSWCSGCSRASARSGARSPGARGRPARRWTRSPGPRPPSAPSPSRRGGSCPRAARSSSRARPAAARSARRWLHRNGPRADEPFVDMNCAGLSREFLETELFGHEKGAYTGAVASKQGLLEVAHRGVMFLDEIGDLDPQVQPKLLKVLEEKRFRRLGEVRDRQVDVQLVAASHQNLPSSSRRRSSAAISTSASARSRSACRRCASGRGHPDPGAPDPPGLRERPRTARPPALARGRAGAVRLLLARQRAGAAQRPGAGAAPVRP